MPTADAARPARHQPALPRVTAPGDPVVCRMWVLTLVGTLCCMACAAGLLSTSGFRAAWWAWVMVAILALPAFRAGAGLIALAVADFCLLWTILGADVGGATALTVFGLHTGVTVWLLAAAVPPSGRWHRSALRAVAVRWLWVQAVAQAASLVAVATTRLTDPLVGATGIVAGVAVVLAVAYAGLRPVRGRR